MSKPAKDEEALVLLTRDALVEVLGREPSKQEVWRVHAGFKRMAFMLFEHLDHIKKYENENIDPKNLEEDRREMESETSDKERTLSETGNYPD